MIVKIGIIFMPFSNPWVKSAVALKWQVGFENGIKMTPIFTIIFNSKMLIKSALHHWNILF